MKSDLNAKHGCVSCSSNLGCVLRYHSFRKRESPVRPDDTRKSRLFVCFVKKNMSYKKGIENAGTDIFEKV
jgi:hypothetical protein